MSAENQETSHQDILEATGILGGAQVIEILMKIGRNKIIAILLGPLGVGLIGLYQSTIDLMRSATGFGLKFSAVRDIAEAAGTGDEIRISRVILILKRWVWFTGILGMTLTLVFSRSLSLYAFGNEGYSNEISVISIVLLFAAISEGKMALLQGLRKVGMMAQAKVWGILAAFCATVPLYWLLGTRGIVPAILVTYIITLILSGYYARKISIQPIQVDLQQTIQGGLGMLRLGFFMVIAGFAQTATMYYLRTFISQKSGIAGVGQFQAAWNLSSIYLSAVLQAMGTDYFPRLSSVNDDNVKVNKLVNEQTEVAILIAGPLIVGMLSLINLVVMILYSSEFTDTIRILHWQLAGTFLKVISWPIAFIILAKGRGTVFIGSEILSNVILVIPIISFWNKFGIEITGIAYLFAYFCYIGIVLLIACWLSGFRWTLSSFKKIFIFMILIALAFFLSRSVGGMYGYSAGIILSLFAVIYSYYELRKIVDLRTIVMKIFKSK